MQVYHDFEKLRVICSAGEGNSDGEGETGIAEKTRPKLQTPRKYKVLLHNDDYTTMEFVIHILKKFFNKTAADAQQIMMHVHTRGVGICGVFTHEVAETKVAQVTKYARKNGHPLRCTSEPCDS